MQKECLQNLNEKAENLMGLLKRTIFSQREISVARQVCEEELVLAELEEIEVSDEVKGFYEQVFLVERKKWNEIQEEKHKEEGVERVEERKLDRVYLREDRWGNNESTWDNIWRIECPDRGSVRGRGPKRFNTRGTGNNLRLQGENKNAKEKLPEPDWWS